MARLLGVEILDMVEESGRHRKRSDFLFERPDVTYERGFGPVGGSAADSRADVAVLFNDQRTATDAADPLQVPDPAQPRLRAPCGFPDSANAGNLEDRVVQRLVEREEPAVFTGFECRDLFVR